jgi:hypothetical protein
LPLHWFLSILPSKAKRENTIFFTSPPILNDLALHTPPFHGLTNVSPPICGIPGSKTGLARPEFFLGRDPGKSPPRLPKPRLEGNPDQGPS